MPDDEIEEQETEQPEAETVMGDAEATVIEPGGTDASTEIETAVDESVSTTVIVEAPEAPVAEAPAEHEHPHAHVSECPACMAAIAEVAATQVAQDLQALAEVVEAEPEPEPPPAPEPEVEPQRGGGFSRFWYGRKTAEV